MIFDGAKKWEIYVLFAVMGLSGIMGSVSDKISLPFWVVPVFYTPFVAVMFLWRPVLTLISYPQIRKHGERAEAVVIEYRREGTGFGTSGNAEIIRYADKCGRKYERPLFTVPMLTRKVGRRYTIYFEPEKEDAFIIVPQGFIAAAMWLLLAALAELPAVIMLLLYNGG